MQSARRQTLLLVLFVGVVLAGGVCEQEGIAADRIERVVVGYGALYKAGRWCPVRVEVAADEDGFAGRLRVLCPDVDDTMVQYGGARDEGGIPVSLGANESRSFTVYVRPGNLMAQVQAVLVDRRGKETDVLAGEGAPEGEDAYVILGVGTGGVLDSQKLQEAAGRVNMARRGPTKVRFLHVSLDDPSLPGQWLGYDMVDAVILSVLDNRQLDAFSPEKQIALLNWVRMGGTLVVSPGPALPGLTGSPLEGALPVDLVGSVHLEDARDIEAFARTPHPLALPPKGLDVPVFRVRTGRVLVSRRGQPLIVSSSFGFGQVIAVAFPLSPGPFGTWDGRHDFVASLLPIALWRQRGQTAAVQYSPRSDIASVLKNDHLERFEGVKTISFQWIAFAIFVYILLIGPADYFIVRKVLKRPELTWVTFTVSAFLISGLAWFAVAQLKGREYRFKQVEFVDVHQEQGVARGSGLLAVFVPASGTLELAIEPEAMFQQGWPQLRPSCVVSWAGVPEDALGGTRRTGSLPLSSRVYGYGRSMCQLVDVPMYTWSAKTFAWTWGAMTMPVVESDLGAVAGYHLTGTLQNKTGFDFDWLAVAYNRRVYLIRQLENYATVRVDDADTLVLSAFVSGDWQSSHIVPPLLRATFYRALGDTFAETNYTLSRLDMSQFGTDPNQALVLGWTERGRVTSFRLDGNEDNGKLSSAVMFRVVVPVRATELSREELLRE